MDRHSKDRCERSAFWALLILLFTAPLCQPAVGQDGTRSLAADTASTPSPHDTSDVAWQGALPNITVTATRLPTPALSSPARIAVFDSTTIAQTAAGSVADLLEDRAGLYIRRYGETGIATMSLRGTGSAQTLVLLDGQPIADPQLGQLDLSLLPSVLLRSVEVMHGPTSALYGSSGMGGAINLQTVQPSEPLVARAETFAGAFGERGGSLLAGGQRNGVSVVAAGELRTSDNDFPYRDRAAFPPRTVQRQNADRTRYTAYASVRSNDRDRRWQTAAWLTHAERGLPRPGGAAEGRERQWDTQIRFWGRDDRQVDWGRLQTRALVQHTRLRYRNPAQNIDDTGRTWTADVDVETRTPIGSRWLATAGVSGDASVAQHPSLSDDARQLHGGTFVSAIGTFGRLRVFPAVRADLYRPTAAAARTAVSPRIGANLQPVSSSPNLRLKAHAGRTFRMPTFNDRFWQPGGNPDLRPERGWSVDAGVHWQQSVLHAEATLFHNWRRDQIIWAPVRSGSWSPENEQRVIARGLEASTGARLLFGDRWSLDTGLTYTYTDARNRSEPGSPSYDAPLRYLPREQAKAYTTIAYGPVAVDVNARYTGRRYISSTGSRYLSPYILSDLQVRLTHTFDTVRTELSVRVDNLNGSDYRTIGNRPMPPRHLHVRLQVGL
ncbi:MAG: TonB-dependent receptor [Bacteroidetes bacterium]|nr:TonB-dependent receptor [Bacteroidota bacterium]